MPPRRSAEAVMLDETDRKRCAVCSNVKPKSDFYDSRNHWTGKDSRCKTCFVATSTMRRRLREFGWTTEQYDLAMEQQGGKCAICGFKPDLLNGDRMLSADHCHDTNSPRGLLCNNCNQGLGKFMDNPELLQRAAEYLIAHQAGNPADLVTSRPDNGGN